MQSKRAVITGLGFVTSIGHDRAAVIESLRALRHGFEPVSWLPGVELPVKVAGTLKGFDTSSLHWADWKFPAQYTFGREVFRGLPPHGLYAMCATTQALADARLSEAEISDEGTGLFCASAGSPMFLHHHLKELHQSGGQRASPMGVVSSIAGTLNFNLATHYRIQGGVAGFVSACASSSHALGFACDEIQLGRHRRIIVVGAEDLNFDSLIPFSGMRALSKNPDPAKASRPFDRQRDGFVGTGGAAVVILEEAEVARARGAPIYAEMLGWGHSADGYNMAISEPEGRGLGRAIERALAAAALTPGDVDYVNAHATSTMTGDRSEALALRRVFGDRGVFPAISSTKALTGHALSMAGTLEAAISVLAISEGFTPGCAHLTEPDEACAGLNLPRTTTADEPEIAISNSSGFGGSNVCLVFRRWR